MIKKKTCNPCNDCYHTATVFAFVSVHVSIMGRPGWEKIQAQQQVFTLIFQRQQAV
jgi:hypothetical protein